jgi:hypothetical protein
MESWATWHRHIISPPDARTYIINSVVNMKSAVMENYIKANSGDNNLNYDLKAPDNGILIQLLAFRTLSVALFLFYYDCLTRFGDWALSPSSGKKPIHLGQIKRASPCLRDQQHRSGPNE